MKLLLFLIFAVSTMFLVTTCCDDCPVCSEPESEEHLFYIVFQDPYGATYIKVFSVEKNDFVDSIGTDKRIWDIDIIGDNEFLVLAGGDGFEQIDLKTKEVVYENPNWQGILEVSPNSKFFSIYNSASKNTEIRYVANHSLVFKDTMDNLGGFSQNSRYYAYPKEMPDDAGYSELLIFDINGDSVINCGVQYWNEVPLYIIHTEIDSNNDKVYFMGGQGSSFYLFSYDIIQNVIRLIPSIMPGNMMMFELDPNLDILYATSLSYPPPGTEEDHRLYMFDTETDELIRIIPTIIDGRILSPFDIAVSYDSRYVATSTLGMYGEAFALYDARYSVALTYVNIPTHTAIFVATKK